LGVRSLIVGVVYALLAPVPSRAADTITLSFAQIERSISVESLEEFAETGTASSDLRLILRFLDNEAEADFREALNTRTNLDVVAVGTSLYDPMIEQTLRYIGNTIQTESHLNGQYALRAAFILSAAQPDGFTFTDIVRNYPTNTLRIDLAQLLSNARRVDRFFQATDNVISNIQTLAEEAAANDPPLNLEGLPDITQPGPYDFTQETLTLTDPSRDRTYPVDLYMPNVGQVPANSVPVVVISHGLGAQRSDFSYAAEHFASYGFAVALPEHIGSNKALQEAVLNGKAFEFFHPEEFVDRPQDISYLLDVLESRNQAEWGEKLDLADVAAIGHSFGGYTVLALGGATVDLSHLRDACAPKESFADFLNPALLLQCRALELEESSPDMMQKLVSGLQDERIQFVVAINPVNRSIFGPEGLSNFQLPIVMIAGGYDVAAPVVPEQAYSFTQIASPEKYLILIQGQAHNPALSEEINQILTPSLTPEELEQILELVRTNGTGLVTAFLKVYIAGQDAYRPFLQPSYVLRLNDPPFRFNMIQELTETQLEQMLESDALVDAALD
jgi:predicted dienelactone hydrolase